MNPVIKCPVCHHDYVSHLTQTAIADRIPRPCFEFEPSGLMCECRHYEDSEHDLPFAAETYWWIVNKRSWEKVGR